MIIMDLPQIVDLLLFADFVIDRCIQLLKSWDALPRGLVLEHWMNFYLENF
jgi:hypothetical protein